MRKSLRILAIVLLLTTVALLCFMVFYKFSFRANATGKVVEAVDGEGIAVSDSLSADWLELPGPWMSDAEHMYTHYAQMQGRHQRNYTVLYDVDSYTSYWVAYPLCKAHMTAGRQETWGYDPMIDTDSQTNVRKGYGAGVPTRNYPKNFYARGHQLPNADRNAVPQMQAQTYYSTNMTPQIQYGFNGAIWKNLEAQIRTVVPQTDTLYVVTGASFNRKGEDLPIKTIVNKNDGKTLPVPNYYWKVALKVKRNGDEITDALAIGFWLPHDDLKGQDCINYAVSVDQIEEWTDFDFFVNLPDMKENPAETNASWQDFKSF